LLALPSENTPFTISILQGNIDQYQKWDDAYVADIEHRYESLAMGAAKSKPDLIVWPESAAPGWIPNEPKIAQWLAGVIKKTHVPNIVGAVTRIEGKDFNAALLFDANGHIQNVYAKQHLVPFGEYIPFGRILARWIPYLGQLGTFNAGSGAVIFTVGALRAAPNICYEAIFAPLVMRDVSAGANAIINITNDGWFLDTPAPEQHYVANIFRAVENGVPVIRAANTGISAVIDSYGREVLRSPLLATGVYTTTISLGLPPRTLYARVGHYFPQLCWIVVALGFLII
jgi:apolipoprotein N-acyltransferase